MSITLITGGIKSGKSSYALKLASRFQKKHFIATAEIFDEEMKLKIKKHQEERDASYNTIESPINLGATLNAIQAPGSGQECIIIDCITLWLNNLFYYKKNIAKEVENLMRSLAKLDCDVFIVTNEIGLGLISTDSDTRQYTNELGLLNQKLMNLSTQAFFMVSGETMNIKQ